MLSLEVANESLRSRSILSKDQETEIFVKTPFSFRLYHDLALQSQAIPIPYLYERTSWRCIFRTLSCRSVPLHVSPNGHECSNHLTVRILSDVSTGEKKEIEMGLRQVFCTDLNLTPFYKKASSDINFSEIVKELVGLKPCLSGGYFEALIKAVIRQLVRAGSARSSIAMLVQRFGTRRVVEGKEYYGFPSSETLANASRAELALCRLGYKWRLIKQLSRDVASEELDLLELETLDTVDVIQILSDYKGVGYWTSRIFCFDGLKRINTYPTRDMSLLKAISLIYHQGESISWNELEDFFEYYRDYVGVAATYLFGALWLHRIKSFNIKK